MQLDTAIKPRRHLVALAGSLGHLAGRGASALYNALIILGETSSRVRELERLNALSDEQLARRGLRREDIVRYVFRDHLI